ncbi:uncharacterized protein [Anser cygnoides]|uniref:uncharacterized protein isoform X2 n=1 Tax=Anser cygnoides TaxID=8845 RepID=UPI0034D216CA
MSPALSLLLSLAGCTLLQGVPFPPQDVRLEAQNFHVQLRWEPDPRTPGEATYQVEWKRRTSNWTRADASWGNHTSSPWVCQLYFDEIYDIYWARVRAAEDGELSPWVYSSELQPYRDTIVGPPRLSWLFQGHILSINVTVPLTPFRGKKGSYKPVNKVLLKLWYWLHLYDGDVLTQQVPCRRSMRGAPCTLRHLKPSTRYCVRTVAVGMAPERSREAEQCLVTPAAPAGFPWVLLAALNATFLLLSVAGLCLVHLYIFPKPSEMRLPKTLAPLDGSSGVPTLALREDALALLLPAGKEPAAPGAPLQPRARRPQETSGYCPNGFGTDRPEGWDTSCTHSQPGQALGTWASLRLEEEEEEHDGDAATASTDSSTGDGDCGTSETWLPLHLQLYSKCPWPSPGAGVSLPPSLQTISFSPRELRESEAGCWVPLSSVKLLASKEEDEGQLHRAVHPPRTELQPGDSAMQQGDTGRAAPGCPCPVPPVPPGTSHMGTLHGQVAATSSEHPSVVLGASEAKCEE